MEIVLFTTILVLIILLFDSYRRNAAMANDKRQMILSRETELELAGRVANSKDPSNLYQYILDACLTLIPKARFASILTFHSEGLLTVKAAAGGRKGEEKELRLEETFLYLATEGKLDRPVIINRPEDLMTANSSVNQGNPVFAAKSEVSAPLYTGGEFAGMLCVEGDQNGAFSEQDMRILDDMSRQIAIVLNNQKLYNEVHYLSRYDSLTRLLNREWFEREAAKLLHDPSKDTDTLYFVLIDLDDLKTANQIFGSHIGNSILQRFSDTIRKHMGKDDFCGRYGGDEFAAVIRGNSVIVNQILEEASEEFMEVKAESGDKSFTTLFSYGKASFREGQSNLNLLYKLADQRLQEMKSLKKRGRS